MKLSIFRFAIIAISLFVAFFAVKYALANLSYLKVDAYLVRWHHSKEVTDAELDDAIKSVDSMLSLHGHFPHYLNVAAKVYEWKAFKYSYDPIVYKTASLDALALYQKSLQVRSHWPLTWAAMANIKANLNQLDDDFYYYYQQAIKFGPYMPEVNSNLAKIQLRYWSQLKSGSTKRGLEQIKRALLNNKSRTAVLNYARSTNRQNIVCTVGRLNDIKQVSAHWLCKK